jgi:hypothetical protein
MRLDWSTFPEYFLIAAVGAACLEFLKLAEAYGKLPEARFKRMLKSRYYRFFTAGMIIIPGLLAWARYAWTTQVPSSPFDLVTTGLAATAALRQISAATEATKKPVLGEPSVKRDVLL